MRKRTLGAVLLAGLALSGAGAFTASNTVSGSTAGYGAGAVSGVAVTAIKYTLNTAQDSATAVSFVTDTDVSTKTLVVKLMSGSTQAAIASTDATIGGTNLCTPVAATGLGATCTFTTAVPLANFTSLAVTVYDK